MIHKNDQAPYMAGLLHHVQHNLFPPLPAFVANDAAAAIEAVNNEDRDKMVRFSLFDTPEGQAFVAAWQVVENLHLEFYITDTFV
jgi:hypothetical protein